MKTVIVNWATRKQTFDGGTADTPSTVRVHNTADADDTNDKVVKTMTTSQTFTDVAAGDYTVTVSKLGVDATADFTIASDDQTFDVPDVITVTVVGATPAA